MDQTYRRNLAISLGGVAGPVVRRGARGEEVAEIQLFLANRGYDVGNIDGRFGPRTEDAVRQFQMETGVSVDGRVGDETRAAMERVSEPAPIPEMRPKEPVEEVAGADMVPQQAWEPGSLSDPYGFPIDPRRPEIRNPDGTVSTERTITLQGPDGRWYNVPTIDEGKQFSSEQAEASFNLGGLEPVQGPFENMPEAERAAEARTAAIGPARALNARDAAAPAFDDEMFSEAKPDLGAQYGEAERSDGLASVIDAGRSAMTGVPQEKLNAYRRILQPDEWAASPGDGQDELRAALLRSIMNRQGVSVAGY